MQPDHLQSPREFLRARRPERFSDSLSSSSPNIDRNSLEYHLGTLTNRNQESDFANFAFKLAERTICPNLRPQTGPTGGGDSKADAETFPVADDLAMAWFTGEGARESAKERWAFAFSAMQKWHPKVKSDVEKIAKTKRGYTEVFFVSSQYIRDKDRAEMEDELRKKYKFKRVTILDRNWILNEVFKNGLQALAIEELHISTPPTPEVQTGPRDARRKKELARLDTEITTLLANRSADTRLVWDGIETARLARELELPRPEVDGRYVRAVDLADKYGLERQKIEALYQQAWTTFWWHEDFPKFAELYLKFEELTKHSAEIGALRKLHNLYNVLTRAKASGEIPDEKLRLNDRTVALSDALERMMKLEDMPSAALEARSMLLMLQAFVTFPNIPGTLFAQFKEVIEQSDGLVGFPLKSTIQSIGEMGDVFADNSDYDDLSEVITTVLAKNDGDIAAASQLLRRSIQKLDGGHDYEAIELSGRALAKLWKNETQEALVQGLYAASAAYERIGLLWAARGSLVNAASLMVNEYHRHHDPSDLRASCFRRLKWLELFLGRLPDSLAWYEIEQGVRSAQQKEMNAEDKEEYVLYDAVLGVYFLRADLATLKKLERLPEVLEAKGLYQSKIALLYALGWEDKAKAEVGPEHANDIDKMMLALRDQPAIDDMPAEMQLGDQPTVNLASNLVGCQVRVVAQDNPACRLIGESVLSALESGMATAMKEHFMPVVRGIDVSITTDGRAEYPFAFKIEDFGTKLKCTITCAASLDPNKVRHEDQGKIKNKLFELLVHVVGEGFLIPDFIEKFEKVFLNEGGFDRALNFTGSIVTLGNVLGHTPPLNIEDWMKAEGKTVYDLKRSAPWDTNSGVPRRERNPRARQQEHGSSDIRHQDIASVVVIGNRLWVKAYWRGTLYFTVPNRPVPPTMALGFDDIEAGKEIFKDWREQFGAEDKKDLVRITVIKGIYKAHPNAYRIAICGNLDGSRGDGKSFFSNITKVQTMQTTDGKNLDNFLKEFQRVGAFWLTFTKMGSMEFPDHPELTIAKRHLVIRDAWTIGVNDIDAAAICADDDPIVPDGQTAPPVAEVLARRRAEPGN